MRSLGFGAGVVALSLLGACGDDTLGFDDDGTTGATGGSTVACDAANASSVCNDQNPCTQDGCSAGACTHTPVEDVPLTEQVGDCKKMVCAGGQPVAENDDSDVYKDGNNCTSDVCAGGLPSNPAVAAGTACTAAANPDAKTCDASGACVECLVAADCTQLPTDDECHTRQCNAGQCASMFTPRGTAVTRQVDGNCLEARCDGAGNVEDVPDDDDTTPDGIECTDDLCDEGLPDYPATAAGTPCATGVCSGERLDPACVECVDNTQCTPGTCDTTTFTCI